MTVTATIPLTPASSSPESSPLWAEVQADARAEGWTAGLDGVELERLFAQTRERAPADADRETLDELLARTAVGWIVEEPDYSKLAARILAGAIAREAASQGVTSFLNSVETLHRLGLGNARALNFARAHAATLEAALDREGDRRFEYFGLRTVFDRYLMRHPKTRRVLETPQHFFMRVAAALAVDPDEAVALYGLFSRLDYLPSSPTLFNAGTHREQLSSCFLLDSPADHLVDIYERYTDVAKLSKFSGGIGLAYHRVRSRGSLIGDTNGHSNGIVPWLKTLDASVAAVNQGGRRKGACCVYLETWHADLPEFLELRDNTGNEYARAHNLNIANWIPDEFMRRVAADEGWSLFDPKTVRHFPDLYGEAFTRAYVEAERAGLAVATLPARELYARMMRTLAQTGNGWMCFKDRCNSTCNQTARPGRTVHLSNLCTEIVEVTSPEETAVCNLGSINLGHHLRAIDGGGTQADWEVDWVKLGRSVTLAVRALDRVIDLNFYPLESAAKSNARWRPVGLGTMGLHDLLLRLGLDFDSPAARELARRVAEHVYFHALRTSCDLARQHGPHPAFPETRAADGQLQFDLWGVEPSEDLPWDTLRRDIASHGLRNSLLVAVAPTATIASIAGCYECIEPAVSNLVKRETLSGEFIQVNRYLIDELRRLGLWDEAMRAALKRDNGSVQGIERVPEALRRRFRTAWELPMRALIDMAAARGPFIDQSQSLNLFVESPDLTRLSAMYFYAWKAGLKTTYYLRSRPASGIAKATVDPANATPKHRSAEALACSLENPEACEACQ